MAATILVDLAAEHVSEIPAANRTRQPTTIEIVGAALVHVITQPAATDGATMVAIILTPRQTVVPALGHRAHNRPRWRTRLTHVRLRVIQMVIVATGCVGKVAIVGAMRVAIAVPTRCALNTTSAAARSECHRQLAVASCSPMNWHSVANLSTSTPQSASAVHARQDFRDVDLMVGVTTAVTILTGLVAAGDMVNHVATRTMVPKKLCLAR